MEKVIKKNEFGIKKKDNRLCLLCREYILNKDFNKHRKICEVKFNK